MTFGHSFAVTGYTLHQLFSILGLVGSALFAGSIISVALSITMRLRRQEMQNSKSMTIASTATTAKSEMSEQPQTEPGSSVDSPRTRTRSKGRVGYAAMVFCAVFGAGWAVGANWPRYPVYEYHNVAVLEKIAPRKYWLSKVDGSFLMIDCNDDDWLVPGYIMAKWRYEDRGECFSMRRADLGIWWLRDPLTKDVITVQGGN